MHAIIDVILYVICLLMKIYSANEKEKHLILSPRSTATMQMINNLCRIHGISQFKWINCIWFFYFFRKESNISNGET